MELKKNDKVIVNYEDTKAEGTVVGSPYRMFTEGESYVEVYIHDLGLEVPVRLDRIEKL